MYDAHWEELAQVRCPALVVRGLDGELGRAEAQEMVRVLPRGQYAEVADAGHLVHYDQPAALARRDRTVPGRRPHLLRAGRSPVRAALGRPGRRLSPC